MLVRYKTLENNEIHEDIDIFIDQLHEKFNDIDASFIRAVVKCFYDAIFSESELIFIKKGQDIQEEFKLDIKKFFSEVLKFLLATNEHREKPNINLNLDGFYGKNLKFLLSYPQNPSTEGLTRFAKYYSAVAPNATPERIYEIVKFIFDAMKDATERGLDGEKSKTKKLIKAEANWKSAYLSREPKLERKPEEFKEECGNPNKRVRFSP